VPPSASDGWPRPPEVSPNRVLHHRNEKSTKSVRKLHTWISGTNYPARYARSFCSTARTRNGIRTRPVRRIGRRSGYRQAGEVPVHGTTAQISGTDLRGSSAARTRRESTQRATREWVKRRSPTRECSSGSGALSQVTEACIRLCEEVLDGSLHGSLCGSKRQIREG
jgi:hypothetical protein